MTPEERAARMTALREEYPQWTGGPFSDQGVDDVIFLLSEVDRLSQELDSAKTERGLAFVEVSAWRQKDDSEKRITKERDTALAQVMALRRFAEHSEMCCIWSSAFTDDAHRCSCSLLTLLATTDLEPKP